MSLKPGWLKRQMDAEARKGLREFLELMTASYGKQFTVKEWAEYKLLTAKAAAWDKAVRAYETKPEQAFHDVMDDLIESLEQEP